MYWLSKPNIKHSKGSLGISSLIKSVLILENKIISPNIKFNQPNLKIRFYKFYTQADLKHAI